MALLKPLGNSLYPQNKFASGTEAKSVERVNEITGC